MTSEKIAGYRDVLTGSVDAPDDPVGAAHLSPISSPELKSLLGIVVASMSVAALYFAQDVLIPIVLQVAKSRPLRNASIDGASVTMEVAAMARYRG